MKPKLTKRQIKAIKAKGKKDLKTERKALHQLQEAEDDTRHAISVTRKENREIKRLKPTTRRR